MGMALSRDDALKLALNNVRVPADWQLCDFFLSFRQ
jgi:hypothetical protein